MIPFKATSAKVVCFSFHLTSTAFCNSPTTTTLIRQNESSVECLGSAYNKVLTRKLLAFQVLNIGDMSIFSNVVCMNYRKHELDVLRYPYRLSHRDAFEPLIGIPWQGRIITACHTCDPQQPTFNLAIVIVRTIFDGINQIMTNISNTQPDMPPGDDAVTETFVFSVIYLASSVDPIVTFAVAICELAKRLSRVFISCFAYRSWSWQFIKACFRRRRCVESGYILEIVLQRCNCSNCFQVTQRINFVKFPSFD